MKLDEILSLESKSLIIAEIAQNHDGSLGMAHAYIDACADVGVNAIKFQTHIASEESSFDDEFRVNFSYQDKSRYEYWKRMEFTKKEWQELKKHADEKKLLFLSTPFSLAAVKLLKDIGVEGWKIGSGDTSINGILRTLLKLEMPMIISTGMSSWAEIDKLITLLKNEKSNFCLMQCTSKYPTNMKEVGLNILHDFKKKYNCRVGLSDHSGSTSPSLAALASGFNVIEVHATFDRRMFGPDVSSSLTLEEIKSIVRFSKDLEIMRLNPINKDLVAEDLIKQKKLFGKSLTYNKDFEKGHIINEKDLSLKKPGSGVSIKDLHKLIGKKLKTDVKINRLLKLEEIE